MRTLSACRSSREYSFSLLSLVTPSTQARHFGAEFLLDLFQAEAGVFHRVVQQARHQADHVHLHVGQDHGDVQRMDHVGLARLAHLALVRVGGAVESFFQEGEVFFGPQSVNLLFQLGIKLIN